MGRRRRSGSGRSTSLSRIRTGSSSTSDNLDFLSELIDGGKVRPQIDRRYSFEEIPAAIGYLEEGHAKGKVVAAVA